MATIPGIDVDLHTPEQDRGFYRHVFEQGPIMGVFEDGRLLGHLASSPGWIDQLYVEPERHGRGVGRMLLEHAQAVQDDLQLWTFQSNLRARRFYAGAGFTEEERTDGLRNEEKQPDVRLRWRKGARP
jgi:GNAT superfamily N-acetyltransferase